MLKNRLQILIDEERLRRLEARARERGVSVAAVVREAIDRAVPGASPRRRRAADKVLSGPSMPVPDVRELRDELEELRARRA